MNLRAPLVALVLVATVIGVNDLVGDVRRGVATASTPDVTVTTTVAGPVPESLMDCLALTDSHGGWEHLPGNTQQACYQLMKAASPNP